MIRIGDKELVYSSSLIIPEGEGAGVSFKLGDWEIKFEIEFVSSPDKNGPQEAKLETTKDAVRLILINWNNALGTAIPEPTRIGETNDGRVLSFMVNHWLIGTIRRLDLQFLLGGRI